MASKKNLSDLLREEVNKAPNSGPLDPQATPAQPLPEQALTSEEASMSPSTSNPPEQTAAAVTEPNRKSSTPKNLSRLTKAELEKKIHHLTEVLQTTEAQEATLREKVSHLEFTIEEQKTSIQDLTTALTQAQSLKTELEQAQTDALKLAQENERLQAQLKTRKQGTVNLKTSPKQPSKTTTVRARSILDRPVLPAHKPNQTGKTSKSFDTWCYD